MTRRRAGAGWCRATRPGTARRPPVGASVAAGMRASPGVDAGTLLAGPGRWWRCCDEGRRDPATRVRRIDHVIDLEVRCGVDRLAVLVGPRHHLVEQCLACVVVL